MGVESALEKAKEALDELLSLDPDALTDSELDAVIVSALRLGHRCDAAARLVAPRWEDRGLGRRGRFRQASGCLAKLAHLSRREAGRVLTQGRQLGVMPEAAAALAAGEVSIDHVDRLAACTARRRGDCYRRDESELVEAAKKERFDRFVKLAAYWRNRTDSGVGDDGDEPDSERHFGHRPGVFGERRFFGDLDPVGGAEVAAVLERIANELAAADRQHPGRVTRSKKVLRADALVEMARRACAMPAGARRPRPLVTVVVGQTEFERLCELSDGTVIGPGDLLSHLDALDIETMIFDGQFRAIEKSDARTFTGALRRAVEVRDRTCQHPDGCDAPIDDCDVDHIVPVYAGGETSQDNGRLMCRFHNRIEPDYCTPPSRPEPDLDRRITTPNLLPMPPPPATCSGTVAPTREPTDRAEGP
jgi:hypothetical protein